jgi:two-component system response regulator LytT
MKEKLTRILSKTQIHIVDDAKTALVERGCELPSGKLAVVFDPIDYLEAVELLEREPAYGQPVDTITGFSNNRYSLIPVIRIDYIEAHGSEILCYSDQETYYLKSTLQYYEGLLNPSGFERINKSQLVNMLNVREIIPWFNSRFVLVLKNNLELEVSKNYSKALRKTLNI